jgi:hypothetical protein
MCFTREPKHYLHVHMITAQYAKHERRRRTTRNLADLPDELDDVVSTFAIFMQARCRTQDPTFRISEIRTHMQTLGTNGNQEFSPQRWRLESSRRN